MFTVKNSLDLTFSLTDVIPLIVCSMPESLSSISYILLVILASVASAFFPRFSICRIPSVCCSCCCCVFVFYLHFQILNYFIYFLYLLNCISYIFMGSICFLFKALYQFDILSCISLRRSIHFLFKGFCNLYKIRFKVTFWCFACVRVLRAWCNRGSCTLKLSYYPGLYWLRSFKGL